MALSTLPSDFQTDVVCRVAVCGYLESGLDGAVFVQQGAAGGAVKYIPLRTDHPDTKAWPEMLRRRLSYEIVKDEQKHFFLVWRDQASGDYHMGAILRSAAEEVVQRAENSLDAARVVTDPAERAAAEAAARAAAETR